MVSLSLIFLIGIFSIQLGLTAPVIEIEDMQSLSSDGAQGGIVAPPNFEAALKFSDETISRDSIEQGIRVDSITDIQRIPELMEDKKATSEESFSALVIKEDNPAPAQDISSDLEEGPVELVTSNLETLPTSRTETEVQEFVVPVEAVEQNLESNSPNIPEDSLQTFGGFQGQFGLLLNSPPSIFGINDTEVTKPRKTVKKDLSADLDINKILGPHSILLEADSISIDEGKDISLEEEATTEDINSTDIAARVETVIQRVRDLQEILGDLRQIRNVQNVVGEKLAAVKSKFETLRDAVRADEDGKKIFIASEKLLENNNFGGFYDLNTPEEGQSVLAELVQPGALHIEEVLSPALKALQGLPKSNTQESKIIPLSLQMSILPGHDLSSVNVAYNSSHKLERPSHKPFFILLGPFTASNGTINASKHIDDSPSPFQLDTEVVYIDPQEGVQPIPVMAIHGALDQWNHLG